MRDKHVSRNSQIISNLFSDCVLSMTLTVLAGALTAMIDGILTSRFLGSQAMAAYGIASAYYSVTSFVRNLLMIGCVSVCTRIIGKHDSKKLSSVFSITVMIAIIISFAWLSFGMLFTENLSVIFGAREYQIEMTSAYLEGVFLGSPAFMCYVILVPLSISTETRAA